MKITCPDCRIILNIPDNRLEAYRTDITIPCPTCNGKIEIRLVKTREASINKHTTSFSPGNAKGIESTECVSLAQTKLNTEELKNKILQKVENLPPMPRVADKARKIILDPDSSFNDLAKVVEADQAIAARVLKFANSSYYASLGGVSSLHQASVVLGTKTLMEILNLACASGILSGKLKGYDLATGDLWNHSLSVASGSRIIANKKRPELSGDAFSAGLIHDVGKLILDPFIVERKEAFQNAMRNKKGVFLMAEQEILGFDHSEIASDVCKKWKIPSSLTSAIKHHHAPIHSDGNELAYIIHMADVVAMMTGIGGGFDGLAYQIDDSVLEFLEFRHSEIEMLMGEVSDCVKQTLETI